MLWGAAAPVGAQAPDATGPATFIVMLRGARVGTEAVSLSKIGSGWLLSGTGRLGAPFDVVTNKFEVNYAPDWQPTRMTLQGSLKGQPLSIATTFGLTTALNDVAQGTQRGSNSHQIQSRAIVLPSGFFSSYEILAARIGSATPGTRFPVYVAPDGETSVAVERVTSRRISLGDRTIDVRVFAVSLAGTASSSNIELWLDDRSRLARLDGARGAGAKPARRGCVHSRQRLQPRHDGHPAGRGAARGRGTRQHPGRAGRHSRGWFRSAG
jgi:hypothetical protein